MSNIKEMYEGNGSLKDEKFVLIVNEDGSLKLTRYQGERVFECEEPVLVPTGKGFRVRYGTGTVKSSILFSDYTTGKLGDKWAKIK